MCNLLKLLTSTVLQGLPEIDDEQKFLLDKINDFNIQTRYPDYKLEFYKQCNAEYTNEYLSKIKECYKWLSSLLKQRKL